MSEALDFIMQKAEELDSSLCDEAAEKIQTLNTDIIGKMLEDAGVEITPIILASVVVHVNMFIFGLIGETVQDDPVETARIILNHLPGSKFWDDEFFPRLVEAIKEL